MANEPFIWTDEMVKEFIHKRCGMKDGFFIRFQEMAESFKQSKIKEKERIEVGEVWNEFNGSGTHLKVQIFGDALSYEKRILIRNAIESILNNEQPIEETDAQKIDRLINEWQLGIFRDLKEKHEVQPLTGEFITKEECERREKEAWWAARKHDPQKYKFVKDLEHGLCGGSYWYAFLYPTFESYKQPK